jgi:two-component sensor histidine kinase
MHKQTNDSIWLATSSGLKLYISSRNATITYSLKDGLPISYFPVESYFYQANDGEIFLSSNNGLIHFYPNKIIQNTAKPVVTLTSIKVDGKELNPGDLDNLKEIKLTYKQNYISIGFAALNLINPSQNQYAYKLERIDKDWIYAGNRNEVIYPNLSPGNYTFKVKASNDAGIWNQKEISLNIHIATPWWKTWWFYILCALVIVTFIYLLYKIRINRLLAEQKLRNKIARDLHDDIGSTLSGIKLFSTIAQNKLQQEKSSALDIVERIGERSEKMMEAMGDIVWSINPSNDSVEKMLVRMRQYAAEMMEPKNINYNFLVNEKGMRAKIDSEDRKDIYLIFKETINNAVKYSQCTEVGIKIDCRDKIFEVTIQDNGKGFDINKVNGNGNGLINLKQRAKDICGEISIVSNPSDGTIVRLIVPVT